MMLLLICDVFVHGLHVGVANAERAVSGLPSECGLIHEFFVDPSG
jgi:hypothetical protein